MSVFDLLNEVGQAKTAEEFARLLALTRQLSLAPSLMAVAAITARMEALSRKPNAVLVNTNPK
jgi:hypothetical protein